MLTYCEHKNAASNRGVRFSTCICDAPKRVACGPRCLYRAFSFKKGPPASARRVLQDVGEINEGLEAHTSRDLCQGECSWCREQHEAYWDTYDPDDYEFVPPAPFKLAAVFMAT